MYNILGYKDFITLIVVMSGFISKIYNFSTNINFQDITNVLTTQEKEIYTFILADIPTVINRKINYFQICTPNKFPCSRKYLFGNHKKYRYINFNRPFPTNTIKENSINIIVDDRVSRVIKKSEIEYSKFLGWVIYNPQEKILTIYNIENIPGSLDMIKGTILT